MIHLINDLHSRLQRGPLWKGIAEWSVQELQCSKSSSTQWIIPHCHHFWSDSTTNCWFGRIRKFLELQHENIWSQDEKNQLLTTCMWFNLVWTDYQLAWNTSEYGGVDSVVIQPRNLWIPDILLYNRWALQDESYPPPFSSSSNIAAYLILHCIEMGNSFCPSWKFDEIWELMLCQVQ